MLVAEIKPDYAIGPAEAPEPALPEGGAILRVTGCGVCGSDLDKFLGKKAPPGSVLGHEVTGVIEQIDSPLFKIGNRIVTAHHVPCGTCQYCINGSESMCRQFKATNLYPGGFAQRLALSAGHLQHTAFQIPDHMSDAEASCVEPLACVLKAVRRSGTRTNGTVVITGLGFIGLLAAQAYKLQGDRVYGLDLDSNRLQLAKQQCWVEDAFVATEKINLPQPADVVFLTVTTPVTVKQALSLVRDGGQIVLFAGPSPHAPPQTTIPADELYFREISVIPSYSPSLQDLQASARLIFENRVSVKPLISHSVPLSEIGRAFELYRNAQALKVFINTESTYQ